jgi:hypothetical protein
MTIKACYYKVIYMHRFLDQVYSARTQFSYSKSSFPFLCSSSNSLCIYSLIHNTAYILTHSFINQTKDVPIIHKNILYTTTRGSKL